MSVLDRLNPWSTTGVGSLPFGDAQQAAAHAVTAYELPFCPQLPQLEGDMIGEWLGSDPGRCGWSAERDRERPRAWDALVAELSRRPPGHRLVKLQVTGPVTLACALERDRGGRPSRGKMLDLAAEIAAWLAANVGAQCRRLAELGFDPVLVIDEPAVGAFGARGIEQTWDPLRTVAPAWGLHLCCRVPWELVERAEPDLLSFDLPLEPIGPIARSALHRHLEAGRWVAWGAIRVERLEFSHHGRCRLEQAMTALNHDGSRGLLTASCGSGRMAPAREREIATALSILAAAMRDQTSMVPA